VNPSETDSSLTLLLVTMATKLMENNFKSEEKEFERVKS